MKIIIVGAGPAGLLLLHYLLRRGNYHIEVYERLNDPFESDLSQEKTFPLALLERAKKALSEIENLLETVCTNATFCDGTYVYNKQKKPKLIARKNPLIIIDRVTLVKTLLTTLQEKYDSSLLKINFGCQCIKVNSNQKNITVENRNKEVFDSSYDILIGADGANSTVRESLTSDREFQYEKEYVTDFYKSVFINRFNKELNIELEANKLHTWRLDEGMRLMLVPQGENQLNGVIIFNSEDDTINNLNDSAKVLTFFEDNFPQIKGLIDHEEAENFVNRFVSKIVTIKCNYYHQKDSILIIGDAAHSVSPSIGQGCNSALEDVLIINSLLDKYNDNWKQVLQEFTKTRIPDAHALKELSDYSFPRNKKLMFEFFLRIKISRFLHRLFPTIFQPFLFDLVSETLTPYSEILESHQGWINKVKNSQKASS